MMPPSHSTVVHEHFCDGCHASPIVGPRYRSTRNPNFDLCRACKTSGRFDAAYAPFTEFVEAQRLHVGISCDGCSLTPIAGDRYKSSTINNFDLCEACEASGKWATHEPFIKIKSPELYIEPPPQVHRYVTCNGCRMCPIIGKRYESAMIYNYNLCESCHQSGAWAV